MSITDIWDPVSIAGIREIIKTRQQDGWDEAWLATSPAVRSCLSMLMYFQAEGCDPVGRGHVAASPQGAHRVRGPSSPDNGPCPRPWVRQGMWPTDL